MGSNLMTRPVFFRARNFLFLENFCFVIVYFCFVGLIGTSLNCFFLLYARLFVVAFSVLIQFCSL